MASPFQCLTSLKAHIGSCHVVRYDNKGRYILSAGSDRTIKLWSTSTSSSTPIKSYNSGHSYDILALDVTSDNSKFTSGGGDKNVLVWDVATSSILRRFSAHEGRIYDLKFAGVGAGGADVLITAGFDATLRFYDLRAKGAWRPIMESKEATDSIQCVQVQQHTVWTGCVDGIVRTYDLRMGQITQDTIDEPIISLTPSQTSPLLLASTTTSTHRLLDTSDGSLLQTFTGHTNLNYRCHSVLNNAEDKVVAGDETGTLHIWDVLSGKQIHKAPAHEKAVLWTECNPAVQGQVVTAGADGMVKLWGAVA